MRERSIERLAKTLVRRVAEVTKGTKDKDAARRRKRVSVVFEGFARTVNRVTNNPDSCDSVNTNGKSCIYI